jgi:hypothetical protein
MQKNPEDDDVTFILTTENKEGKYYLCGDCFDDVAGRDKVGKCHNCKEWVDLLEPFCPNCKSDF